jgi:hypothetical protein
LDILCCGGYVGPLAAGAVLYEDEIAVVSHIRKENE